MKNLLFVLIVMLVTLMGFKSPLKNDFSVLYIPKETDSIESVEVFYMNNGKTFIHKGVKSGERFIIKGNIPDIIKGNIVLIKGFSLKFIPIILEPGEMIVKSLGSSVAYDGTNLQREFMAFNNMYDDIALRTVRKRIELEGAEKKGESIEKLHQLKEELRKLDSVKQRGWEQYFEQKKNPIITAFKLEDYVTSDWINLEKAEHYYQDLPHSIKNLPGIKEFGIKLKNAFAYNTGKKCPNFSLPDSMGKMVDLSKFEGKFVLVDFWASWCKPCRQESPALVSLYNQYKKEGFEILSVSFDKDKQKWYEAISKDNYTWKNVIDIATMSKSEVATLFNITSIPRNFLLNEKGVIVAKNIKMEELRIILEEKLLKKRGTNFSITL